MSEIWCQLLGIALGSAWLLTASSVTAQITPDRTLPNNSSVTINGSTFTITGGTQAGRNLFHSFQQFSVPTGSTAAFNNGLEIQNVVSRITGGSVSNIDGIIQANGTANVFLLNPNGIIFGPNGRLNIGGSFVATTANAIGFGNLGTFSATVPNDPTLLTVNPSALFFNQLPIKSIVSSSVATADNGLSGLGVPNGHSLLLVGGDVSIDGGGRLGGLFALGGRVELGGLAAPGTVGLSIQGNQQSLSYPEGVARADVSFTNQGSINVQSDNGGSIVINAGNVNVGENSILFAGIGSRLATVNSRAGDIDINATKTVTLTGGSAILSTVDSGTVGNTGDINITTGTLSLTSTDISNPTLLSIGVIGQGRAGNIRIKASDSVHLDRASALQNEILRGATGTGGDIEITTREFSANNSALVVSSTGGRGNAGNIKIQANDVRFDTSSGVQSAVLASAIGNAGNIEILAQSLSLTNSSGLGTSAVGQGNAGNILVQATDNISLANSAIVSNVGSIQGQAVQGNVGNIELSARTVSLTDSGQLQAGFYSGGQGNPGFVSVTARDSISFTGTNSGIFTNVEQRAVGNGSNIQISAPLVSVTDGAVVVTSNAGQGNGGNINITTGSFFLNNGAVVNTSNVGQGNAGNVTVQAIDNISLADSLIVSNIGSPRKLSAKGTVGNIVIDARKISVTDGAQLQAGVYAGGEGNPGIVSIKARDSISFAGTVSGIFTNVDSGGVGSGSDIQISAPSVSFTNSAGLTASNSGQGNSGNISISAGAFSLTNSPIFAQTASSGNGGNITFNLGNYLLLRNGSKISTNAGTAQAGGNGGNITINTPFVIAVPFENSDITANAFNGQGGKVTIDATGIYNIAPLSRQDLQRLRPQDLDPSQLLTNDITAVSQQNPSLSGTVQVNTPDIDPSRGLVTLPTITENSPKLVASSCAAFNEYAGGSQFAITGRGGLPPSPDETLTTDVVWTDTRLPVTTAQQHQQKTHTSQPKPQPVAIVPATGWVFNNKGEVTLISAMSNATSSTSTSSPCHYTHEL
jgi:filamentous hemagglutinin family protein